FSLFWEAWNVLEENYVEPDQLNEQEMIYGAISGMIKSLKDPHTVFFNPENNKKFLEDVSGSFEGVGMQISIKKEQLQVIAPLKGTPAQTAGIRSGDKIIKIGDTSTSDITIDEAVSLIRGPKGTEVILTIFRDGWDNTKEFTIKRDTIEIPTIDWELKNNDTAYIQLYNFSENADYLFSETALQVLKSSAKNIILDLRNNPGGYLEVSQRIAGWFLEKGQIVVIEDFRNEKDKKPYESTGNSRFSDYPIVVLINQGSASASEILAAALRDNLGAKLLGETSFGKGSVQELKMLSNGSSLKVTIAKWLTPNGELIDGIGLEPDIKVEITEEDYENERDPQLEKALEIIKEMR
ncbi:MAG: S41 family peptidase, partial [Candidatus Nealsonbacteria bacterium]